MSNEYHARQIAEAFRQMYSAAMKINEALLANDDLNGTVPEDWPLPQSADDFAFACGAMAEHYDQLAKSSVWAVGDRVRLVEPIENYPVTRSVEVGETGTIVGTTDEHIMVRLDKLHEELAEWDNELEVWREWYPTALVRITKTPSAV